MGASGGEIKNSPSGAGRMAYPPLFQLLHMLTEVLHVQTYEGHDKAMTVV